MLCRRNEHNIVNQLYFNKIKKKKKRWLPPQEGQLLYFSSFNCLKIIHLEAQLFSYWTSHKRHNFFKGYVLSLSSHKLFREFDLLELTAFCSVKVQRTNISSQTTIAATIFFSVEEPDSPKVNSDY